MTAWVGIPLLWGLVLIGTVIMWHLYKDMRVVAAYTVYACLIASAASAVVLFLASVR